MIKLNYKGEFLADNNSKKLIEKHFPGKYEKKRNFYVVPGNFEVFNKILILFPENEINYSCYLYPILETSSISQKTKQLYFQINKNFLDFVRKKPNEVKIKEVQAYLEYLKKSNKKPSTIRITFMALRLFYEKMLDVLNFDEISIPKTEGNIPEILSRQEVKDLLSSINDKKYRLVLKIAYCCGLKLNEILRLRVEDIDMEKKIIKVMGKNERRVPISESLFAELKEYLQQITGSYYLFPSKTGEKPITQRSVEIMFKNALKKADLPLRYTFSVWRDSSIVHMLEKNCCLDVISSMTGLKKSHIYDRYKYYIELIKKYNFPDMLDFSDVA